MTTENTDQPPVEDVVSPPSTSALSTVPPVASAPVAAAPVAAAPVAAAPVAAAPVVSRKPKKKLIQVAGNPQFAPAISRKNKEIPNPTTNSVDWAHMPALTTSGKTFPAGPIRLRYGEHLGHERGFGLTHIWEARKYKSPAMPTPMHALVEIEKFIMSILQVGTEIFYEVNRATIYDRAMVFKTKVGTVIVEERADGNGNAWYSIITAIPRTNAKGILIGNL